MTDTTRVPPREPFAYMSDQNASIPKIREPILEILFGVVIVMGGVACMHAAIHPHHGNGSVGAGVFVLILFASGGGAFCYIGLRRLRWKRAYRRAMGHNPW